MEALKNFIYDRFDCSFYSFFGQMSPLWVVVGRCYHFLAVPLSILSFSYLSNKYGLFFLASGVLAYMPFHIAMRRAKQYAEEMQVYLHRTGK